MKRLVVVIMIMVMIMPTVVIAENYAGCWGIWIPKSATLGNGNLSFIIILNEDHTFSWLLVDDSVPDDYYADTCSGKWEADGTRVYITNESGEKGWLDFADDMLWIDMSGKRAGLKKLPDYDINQMVYD
jgi:hypothetical protein